MANDKQTATSGATPVTFATPTPVILADDGKIRRALLEKELMGIRAKLRWSHLGEGARMTLQVRETQVLEALKG